MIFGFFCIFAIKYCIIKTIVNETDMVTQSEAALEQGLIKTLQDMSYEYVKIEEETNLDQNFKTQLEKHNKKELARHGRTSFTDSEFEKIKIHLEGGTRFEKAKKLRDLFPLELETGERVWVEFLNRQQWCQNEFQVSNQITVEGRKKCRYDVTILINGLPLVQIELKKRGVELKQAYNQIQRYHKTSFHGLFDYIQLFVISNGVNTRYFANNPNSGYKFTFNWTDAENVPFNDLSKFALFFFDKCTLGKMISKYIVLHEGDKCLMVLRPYQYYAVEKILDRVQNSNKNGYIWHTTGAGKTLTSFKAAQLVSEIDGIDKVMFVVDRHDLDTQTQSEYEVFEPGAVDGTDNTYELIKRLSGKSKIIITTIQKLNCAVTNYFRMKHCHEFEEMLRVKLSNKLISLLIFPLFLVTGVFFVANNIYIPFPEESIAIKESNYDILGNDKIEIASSSINSKNLYTRYCVEKNSKTVTTLSFLSFNKKKE